MTTSVSQSDAETPAGFRLVEISREPVELYKILKFEGMAESGGQAKVIVASGQVLVNGKVETQKRKKIRTGDTIEFNDEKICIKLSAPERPDTAPPKIESDPPERDSADAQGSGKE